MMFALVVAIFKSFVKVYQNFCFLLTREKSGLVAHCKTFVFIFRFLIICVEIISTKTYTYYIFEVTLFSRGLLDIDFSLQLQYRKILPKYFVVFNKHLRILCTTIWIFFCRFKRFLPHEATFEPIFQEICLVITGLKVFCSVITSLNVKIRHLC